MLGINFGDYMKVSQVRSVGLKNPLFKGKFNNIDVKNTSKDKNVLNAQPIKRPLFK